MLRQAQWHVSQVAIGRLYPALAPRNASSPPSRPSEYASVTVRREDERLHGDVGIHVVVAHDGDHAPPGELLDPADELAAHRHLERLAHAEHLLAEPVAD